MEIFINESNVIKFTIGDSLHTVCVNDITPETTLNEYLREKSLLTGTKVTCREGGCGVCIVAAEIIHPVTKQVTMVAVNSCLVAVYSCAGWKIRTIEGIGSSQTGYHPIQKTLSTFNGSQCGFCSPGMVMNMYALYQKGNVTMEEVENSFGGNLCRCTGYRPILAAFKSLAVDASVENIGKYPGLDIEDLNLMRCSLNSNCVEKCERQCEHLVQQKIGGALYSSDNGQWYMATNLWHIITIFNMIPVNQTYTLVAGNTGKGVYKSPSAFQIYIDINNVPELKTVEASNDLLKVGGNITLNEAIATFNKVSSTNPNFSYLKKIASHLDLVATVPVRNIGTLAGNLMLKYKHNEFISDVFLLLVTAGASLSIVDRNNRRFTIRVQDFLIFSMDKKVIEKIIFPQIDPTIAVETYKIMPRTQNAHAFINAGFMMKQPTKIELVKLVFGGINPQFIRATKTEEFLSNKNVFDNGVLKSALNILDTELYPNENKPQPSPAYRRGLAKALFYKFVLSIAPDSIKSPRNISGGGKLLRPLSKGTQDYETQTSLYPIHQAIGKLESAKQTAGEAQFIYDLPDLPNQLYASFVLLKCKPKSIVTNVDATEALKLSGVVAYFGKDHIPGVNSFTPISPENAFYTKPEEIFCSGVVNYFDQPIGIIVAKSWKIAEKGAELVKVTYVNNDYKPLTTIRDVLKRGTTVQDDSFCLVGKTEIKNVTEKLIKGEINVNTQYHFHMETQCAQVIPMEDGFDMFVSSQYMDYAQKAVAECLGIMNNKVNITVRRLGGAFGAKISRGNLIACAASIAAHHLRKPVKLLIPLDTNMRMIGKRIPNLGQFETTVDDAGIIKHINFKYFIDLGAEGGNEDTTFYVDDILLSSYGKDRVSTEAIKVFSDIPTTTYMRGPGGADGLGLLEGMMEQVAYEIGMDPLEFRIKNIDTVNHQQLLDYVNEFKTWAVVDKRKADIAKFNEANRWIKKGISVVLMSFGMPTYLYYPFLTYIAIYNSDGTVAIGIGGIEMGQGINTKVAQVCAHELGISMEMIVVKPSNTYTNANSYFSGGSVTSEACCYGIMEACKILNDRITPIKNKMPAGSSWLEIITQSHKDGIDLTASGMYKGLPSYTIYGVAASEVTVDILTGQHIIDRTDILEDTGSSLNPTVDIGQIEGGFVMGIGLWTTEKTIYDENGENLTHNTWEYKIPGAKDIPVEFNVKLPKNAQNPNGVFNSKSTGEPPLCLAVAVPLAIRNAVASARKEANANAASWYPLDGPSTIDDTFINSLHDIQQYTL